MNQNLEASKNSVLLPIGETRRIKDIVCCVVRHGRRPILFLLFLFLWSTTVWCQPVYSQASRPNIILINVDDLDTELFETGCATQVFPTLQRLASEGVKFSNCHVTSPLCGPSRASLLTGLYVHRHGFRVQEPENKVANGFDGGFQQYQSNFVPGTAVAKYDWTQHDISRQMQDAGYRTMLVGKYLHGGFSPEPGERWSDIRPTGWDDFYCTLGGRYFGVTQYLSRRNGEYREELRNLNKLQLNQYPTDQRPLLYSRYRTNVEMADALSLVQEHLTDRPDQPYFLYLAPFAPHLPDNGEMVDNRYQLWWRNLLQPHAIDFAAEADENKPFVLRRLTELTAEDIQKSDEQYRERMLAMKSFDDMLGNMLSELENSGALEDTIIFFTSDNGYMEGHQRHFGKQLPYDRCTQVPMFVWGPQHRVSPSATRQHLISHVDILPTLLQLAQASPPLNTDGQSFSALFSPGDSVPEVESWRPQGVLCEHYQRLGHAWQDIEGVFISLRTDQERLTQWGDGLREFYDLTNDPYELENQYDDLSDADKNLFQTLLRGNLLGDPFVTTIGIPEKHFQVFRSQQFLGYAISPLAVKEVRLVFRRINEQGQPEYLDGEQWSTNYAQNPASLEVVNETLTRWSYDFQPDGNEQYPVTLTARAYGKDGSYQQLVTERKFVVEHAAPGTSIDAETGSQLTFNRGTDWKITGSAKGIQDIREVRLVIKDQQTGEFFDGQQWVNQHRQVLAQLQTYGDPTFRTWSFTLPAEETRDRIYLNARAYQVDGEYDTTLPWVLLRRF